MWEGQFRGDHTILLVRGDREDRERWEDLGCMLKVGLVED